MKRKITSKLALAGRLSVLALVAGLALLLSGCYDNARNNGPLSQPIKESNGIRYKLVEIEGKTFVATQTNIGYWTLAGPID